jgi:hypothetical protein
LVRALGFFVDPMVSSIRCTIFRLSLVWGGSRGASMKGFGRQAWHMGSAPEGGEQEGGDQTEDHDGLEGVDQAHWSPA